MELADVMLKGETKTVQAGEVQVHPENPRQGNIGTIYESIKENGWYGHLYIQKSTDFILIGNHRFMAGRELGMTEFPAIILDIDDIRAKRIMLVDNRSSDEATYNDPVLIQLLTEQAEEDPLMLGTGFDANDLDDLLDAQDEGLSFDGDRRLTPSEKKHIYDSSTIRQIILLMDHNEHEWAIAGMQKLMDERGLEDNTSVVLALLKEAIE